MSHSTAPGTTYEPESLIGDTYKVLRFLGSGGMGTVYAVINLKNGQRRALKLLNRDPRLQRPDFEARFMREGHLLQVLCGQPYLVEVYDSGRLPNGRLFIEMEHLQGRTLHDLLADERLSMSQSVAFVAQLLIALDAVHGANIVHRDVKPANVFVLNSGLCKLLDFGVVKVLVDGAISKKPGDFSTAPGSIIGTMPYIAPEYADDTGKPDHRADIFSAGAILGECLMGSEAFNAFFYGKDYISHVTTHGYPSLQEMGADDTPHELQRVFRLATMKDPADRYQTAQQFLSDLLGVSLRLGLTVRAYEEPSHDPPTPPAWSGLVARQKPRQIGARHVPPTVTLPDPMATTAVAELPSSQRPTPVYPSKRVPLKPQGSVEAERANAPREDSRPAVVVPFARKPVVPTRRLPATLLSEGQTSGLRQHIPSAPWLEQPISSDVPATPPPDQVRSSLKEAAEADLGASRAAESRGRESEPSATTRSAAQAPPTPVLPRRGPRPPLSARAGRASLATTFGGVTLLVAAFLLVALARRPEGEPAPALATTSDAVLPAAPAPAPAPVGEAPPALPAGEPAEASHLPTREATAAVMAPKATSPKTPARERPQGREAAPPGRPLAETSPRTTPSDATRFKRGLDSGFLPRPPRG